jgi:hypothetical protein
MVNCMAQGCGWLVGSTNVDNAGFAFDFGKFATIVGCIGVSNWANLLLLSQNQTRVSDSVFFDSGSGTTNVWIVGGSRTVLQNCWIDTLAGTPSADHVAVYCGPKIFWAGPSSFNAPAEVHVEDCYIRGQYGIWLTNVNGFTGRGLFVSASEGINIRTTTNAVIRSSIFTAGSVGVRAVSGSGISIADNDFRPQAINGAVIVNQPTEFVTVSGNRAWSTNWSFRLLGGPEKVTLVNNIAYGPVDYGAHHSVAADNVFHNGLRFTGNVWSNTFARNIIGRAGIWFDTGAATPSLANQRWLQNTATNLWGPVITNGLTPVPDLYGPWIGLATNGPPSAPASPGMVSLWNSNGILYALGASASGNAWVRTNQLTGDMPTSDGGGSGLNLTNTTPDYMFWVPSVVGHTNQLAAWWPGILNDPRSWGNSAWWHVPNSGATPAASPGWTMAIDGSSTAISSWTIGASTFYGPYQLKITTNGSASEARIRYGGNIAPTRDGWTATKFVFGLNHTNANMLFVGVSANAMSSVGYSILSGSSAFNNPTYGILLTNGEWKLVAHSGGNINATSFATPIYASLANGGNYVMWILTSGAGAARQTYIVLNGKLIHSVGVNSLFSSPTHAVFPAMVYVSLASGDADGFRATTIEHFEGAPTLEPVP